MEKVSLNEFYVKKRLSAAQIAAQFDCSESKVNYWIKRHHIQKRSISDAIYTYKNPNGDPFKIEAINSIERSFLYGLGLGLYWGEGTKRSRYAVRLGNTDPAMIKLFIKFLSTIYSIDGSKLRFGLQLFNDSNPEASLQYWRNELKVSQRQFYKVIISKIRGEGSYKNKSQYGVLTIYFHNKKLRDIINTAIENLKKA